MAFPGPGGVLRCGSTAGFQPAKWWQRVMRLDRRRFLKGMALTAAGLLLPADVVASPERRIWQLDQTQIRWRPESDWVDTNIGALSKQQIHQACGLSEAEIVWVSAFDDDSVTVLRGQGGSVPLSAWHLPLDPTCPVHVGDYLRVDARGAHPLGISGAPNHLGFSLAAALPPWDESLE